MIRWLSTGWTAAILCLFSTFWTSECSVNYKYLGCFKDNSKLPDITGLDGTLDRDDFSFHWCVNLCQESGYPYAGVKDSRKCSCGHTYGRYGTSPACNYTCETIIPCGGYEANDLFYTIEIDATSESLRDDNVYTTEMTFEDARSLCLKYEGDILPIYMSSDWTKMKTKLNDAGITSGKMWLGLRRIFDGGKQYSYTDRSKPGFSSSSYSNWADGETQANPCVAVNLEDGTWESTSCTAQYPFICHQQPAPEISPTDADDGSQDGDDESTSAFDMSKLSLYIILPLFGFCYGGSCLMYCIHKIYKALKRKKRQKMLLAKLDDLPEGQSAVHRIEYEPDSKPTKKRRPVDKVDVVHVNDVSSKLPPPLVPPPPPPQSGASPPRYTPHPKPQSVRPFSASRRSAVHPIMGPPPMFKDPTPPPLTAGSSRTVRTPVEEVRISPRGEPEGAQAQETPSAAKYIVAKPVAAQSIAAKCVAPKSKPAKSIAAKYITVKSVAAKRIVAKCIVAKCLVAKSEAAKFLVAQSIGAHFIAAKSIAAKSIFVDSSMDCGSTKLRN
ncbi:hypothetical protein LSH36_24g12150 [Paralvinella palmiformis]|uniref:C-type lectin domain-containing protein n=1 Tax=Paralvinella palmiformis TaxID=53620 RepID=A0AAD9K9Y8_9ANNE|nr:hypothetical protein LSH36_24g12150 [Paralvinella palmiformis]